MKIEEFYVRFNEIAANHTSVNDTKEKLNALLNETKGTDIEDKVSIDVDKLTSDLEEQRNKALSETKVTDDYESQDHENYDEYDGSYDYDDSYSSSY